MLGGLPNCIVYTVQVVSVIVWTIGIHYVARQQKTLQHTEWHAKAVKLFMAYCVCEFFRVVDCFYPEVESGRGIVYSVWGVFPFWVHVYSWVVRDLCMFRGISVYVEHALVWSHSCMGWPVPKGLLWMQQCFLIFGNVCFFIVSTCYLRQNDKFWEPLAALAQIPPNIGVAIVCFYLYRSMKQVPDCPESRLTWIVIINLLVAAFTCILIFIPWAIPKALDLYSKKLPAHPTIPNGVSILTASGPPLIDVVGILSVDLTIAIVEITVGWSGFMGLLLVRGHRKPEAGESLVLSSEEVGRIVAKSVPKKDS